MTVEQAYQRYQHQVSVVERHKKSHRKQVWSQLLWDETDGRCVYCGQHTPTEDRTVEHVIPRALGGKAHVSNLMPACRVCNNHKPNVIPPTLYCKDLLMFFYVLAKEITAHQYYSLTNRKSH